MGSEGYKALISRIADDVWNRGDLAVVDEVMSTPHNKAMTLTSSAAPAAYGMGLCDTERGWSQ